MKNPLLFLLFFIALLSHSVYAQTPNTSPVTAYSTPITEYQLAPEKLKQAETLYYTRMVMYVAGTIYSLVLLALLLWLRAGVKLRDIAEHLSARRGLQVLIFAPLLLLTIAVLELPLQGYGHYIQSHYGLSVQGWASWLWDWFKNAMVNSAIATLLIWGLYTLVRFSPKRWWLLSWLAAIPVIVALVLVKPIIIDPLFNTFTPLETTQPTLLLEVEKVMQRGGLDIERSRMFEMQASDKTTTYNAYVAGIGASKRVVVWDTTAKDMSIPETLFVFAHEQGHYVLQHIWITLAFLLLGLLVALYLVHVSIDYVLLRWGQNLGIRALSDWASLPVLLLMFNVFAVLGQPISSSFSRYLEHQADMYGLEAIHGLVPDSAQAAAHGFQKLGEKGLAFPNPNPWYVFWIYDHPPIADRIRFAATYQPWNNQQANRFIQTEAH